MTTFGGLQTPVAVAGGAAAGGLPVAVSRRRARWRWPACRGASGPRRLLLAAPAWVATELGRQYVWDGFPWALLGYSQITWLPIAQLASITGVYGLSLLLALTSVGRGATCSSTRGSRRLIVAGGVAMLIVGAHRVGRAGGLRTHRC